MREEYLLNEINLRCVGNLLNEYYYFHRYYISIYSAIRKLILLMLNSLMWYKISGHPNSGSMETLLADKVENGKDISVPILYGKRDVKKLPINI